MTPFYKVSGAGNDFIALVAPEPVPNARWVRSCCRRGLSVGADGVLHLQPEAEAVRVRYFNADGTRAELCLNACRCAGLLTLRLGWAREEARLVTDHGPLVARATSDESKISVDLGRFDEPIESRTIRVGDRKIEIASLDVGVPHAVVCADPIEKCWSDDDISLLGPGIRHHEALAPRGANVNFLWSSKAGWHLRTFERGVEAETLACGTGAVASARLLRERGLLPHDFVTLHVRSGATLEVGVSKGRWVLAGDARVVASGELDAGALHDFDAPAAATELA